MTMRKVGVLGAGLMGAGIAEVSAKAGYTTVVREVTGELAAKGLARIDASMAKAVEKGKLSAADRDAAKVRLSTTTRTYFRSRPSPRISAKYRKQTAKMFAGYSVTRIGVRSTFTLASRWTWTHRSV